MYSRLKSLYLAPEIVQKMLIPAIYQSSLFKRKVYREQIALSSIEKKLSPYDAKKLPHPLFKKFQNKVVEFCCGTGEFLVRAAQTSQIKGQQKDTLFIGVDYIYPCVERGIKLANTQQQDNILFYHGEARDFLWDLQNFKFKQFMINFPDPWPKKRHLKRRIVNEDFLKILQKSALPNAELITATDVPLLYYYHSEILNGVDFLKNTLLDPQQLPTEYYNYSSRYERKRLSKSQDIFYTRHQFI